eukprot:m.30794 g.30794  ORF g.30794 m.30794 type:complete len:1169 (-) comp6254_c0_seq1:160-3666(-)
MRFNEKELRLYGMHSTDPVDFEGFLFKRGERSRDTYKKRYFVLRGNLLFYFQNHQVGAEPSGCIVLERASVVSDTSEDHIQKFKFNIEFDSPDARVYFLYSTSLDSRETWIDKIRKANFELLRKTVMQLRKKLEILTGKDSIPPALKKYLEPDVAQVVESKDIFRKSMRFGKFVSKSNVSSESSKEITTRTPSSTKSPPNEKEDFNTIEISIDCQNLSLVEDESLSKEKRKDFNKLQPTVFVTLHKLIEDNIWIPGGRTETIQACSPRFHETVCLTLEDLKENAKFKFSVYHIPNKPSKTVFRNSVIADASLNSQRGNGNSSNSFSSSKSLEGSVYNLRKKITNGDMTTSTSSTTNASPSTSSLPMLLSTPPLKTVHESNRISLHEDCIVDDILSVSSEVGLLVSDDDEDDYEDISTMEDDMDDDSEDEADVIANLTLETEGELSENNPFRQTSQGDEALARLLGWAVLESDSILGAVEYPQLSVKLTIPGKKEAESFSVCRLQCRRTTSAFVQLPTVEFAPEGDDNEECDDCIDLGRPSRDPVSSIYSSKPVQFKLSQAISPKDPLQVKEVMKASPYFLTVPIQLLKLYIAEDAQEWKELNAIDVVGSLQKVKRIKSDRAIERKNLYNEEWAFLDCFNQPQSPFKKSTQKKIQLLEMVPTNMHIQTLKVESAEHGRVFLYETITMGCPAAHSLGFKKGGLNDLLQADKEEKERQTSSQIIKPQKYKSRLEKMDEEFVKWQIVLKGSEFRSEEYNEAVKHIRHIAEEMQNLYFHQDMQQAVGLVASHRPQSIEPVQCADFPNAFKEALDHFLNAVDGNQPKKAKKAFDICENFFGKWVCDMQYTLAIIELLSAERKEPLPDIIHREDVVRSQVVTTLATAFISMFHHLYKNERFLLQLQDVGILLQVSSYLSTYGNEQEMLLDSIVGWQRLAFVNIKFSVVSGKKIDPQILGSRKNLIIDIGITRRMMNILPENLQNGGLVSVHPVMFSQGVNETQTYANKVGDNTTQLQLNKRSENSLSQYREKYLKFIRERYPVEHPFETDRLRHLQDALKNNVKKKLKGKNIRILHVAEEMTRHMNGIRVTMCKSGKDRTGMAVTLESAQLLVKNHDISEKRIQVILDELRSKGTRRLNVQSNTGSSLFAFNSIQKKTLPRLLQPPEGTYGLNVS